MATNNNKEEIQGAGSLGNEGGVGSVLGATEGAVTNPEPKAKAKEAAKEEMVTISKADLKALFDRMEKQSADIKTLYSVADKGRLERFDPANKESNLIRTCKAWFYENKMVIATKLTANTSDIVNGRATEDLQLEVFFEDGESTKLRYRDFEVHKEYRKAEIVGTKTEDDETFFKLLFPDGHKAELSVKFIN